MKNIFMAFCGFVGVSAFAEESVKVSSFGYDPVDSTAIVQKALDSGAKQIVFDKAAGSWVIGPVQARGESEILFEEGVQLLAKPGDFLPLKSALFSVVGVTNLTLRGLGAGATLRMRLADYQKPPYKKSEWRHALCIKSSRNVLVENLTLADSGGDGIYLGVSVPRCPNENVTIRRCVCDNNNRQGISVISARHLLIEDTVMKNTRGTAPKSGIDFEPNNPAEVLVDCVMRNCLTENNDGAGYDIYLGQLGGITEPVSITLENCRSVNDRRGGVPLSFNPFRHNNGLPKGGFLKVKGCTFIYSSGHAIALRDKPLGVMDVSVEDCVFANVSTNAKPEADIVLAARERCSPQTDGIHFRNVTIRRPTREGWFRASARPWMAVPITGVTGSVNIQAEGTHTLIALDEAWRAANLPQGGDVLNLEKVAFDPAKAQVVDTKPGEAVKLAPVKLRDGCEAIVYAAKPGPVSFTVALAPVNRNPTREEAVFVVRNWKGKKVATLPPPERKAAVRTFTAPEAGFCRLSCQAKPHALVFSSCDAPIGFQPLPKDGFDVYKSKASLHFTHAAGTDAAFFCGGAGGEYVTVSLVDPAGTCVRRWENQGDWGFCRLAPDAPEGLWRVDLTRPAAGMVWEDSYLDLTGMAPVFFLTSEKYWR
ncbi:MAG: right-handed parallel beta-helix repeat-containing protein [Kiritimatiellae bacterium]|nr:right-handed parallel beta-helix repeat-containing protein [Kiritimatiellia bacterium]